MSVELSILIPVLGRPEQVLAVSKSIKNATPDAQIAFAVTPGDVEGIKACKKVPKALIVEVERQPTGDYARKINTLYNAVESSWVFLGATDLRFHRGWFRKALKASERAGGVGVVGTNDLGNPRVVAGQHSTHSLVHWGYVNELGTIDEPGKILHEGYIHEFCDDEFVQTAIYRGQFVMALESVVEHLHPYFDKAKYDTNYLDATRRTQASQPLYNKRKKLWSRSI